MDIHAYHEGRGAFDSAFAIAFLNEGDTESLDRMKSAAPGRRVIAPDHRLGHLPRGCTDFPETSDIERHIAERDRQRAAGDYRAGDIIRQRMARWGYELRDTKTGTDWIARKSTSPGTG